MNAEALQSICLQIEQERPDLTCMGGDLVDEHTSREEMKELFETLSQVTTQYGIYYIYGNHDRKCAIRSTRTIRQRSWRRKWKTVGITVLRENAVDIEKELLLLVGRDDRTNPDAAGRVRRSSSCKWGKSKRISPVLLEHQPRNLKEDRCTGL